MKKLKKKNTDRKEIVEILEVNNWRTQEKNVIIIKTVIQARKQ